MSTQKRRVIYMTDQEWADLKDRATREDRSISAFLRWHLTAANLLMSEHGPRIADAVAMSGMTQPLSPAAQDSLASWAQSYNPVPKPSQRKAR